jgi:carboxymethylenebutenolidase
MIKTLILSATLLLTANLAQVETKTAPSSDTALQALKDSPRHGEWADVDLPGSDTKIHTWVVYPERKDKAPVVIVIHEIFGMTDWVRSVADQLAAEGYIAVAPDLVSGMGPNGGGSESLGQGIMAAIQKLKQDEMLKRLDAVRDYAIALPSANGKSASIGFCWGGGASFLYATHQPKLAGAIVFYGTPPNKDALAKIQCPVIGFYGGDDARVTSTVDATKKQMEELKKEYTPNIYDGAGHGFMRQQNLRDGANQKAADASWKLVVEFLKKNLE